MANNFSFLFNNDVEQSFEDKLDNKFEEKKAAILAGGRAFEQHKAQAANKSLYDGLLELGADIEAVSPKGYPAILVGDPDIKPSLALNTFSAINAILAMAAQKYQVLTPYRQDAWFDPRYNAEGVRTVWSDRKNRWVIFNWDRKGSFVMSNSIVPAPWGTKWNDMSRGEQRYKNQSQKAQAISEYLLSKEYETPFLVVMNRENELTHFQEKIRDRLEMPLPEVWEEINKDWENARVKGLLTSTKPSTSAPSVKPSEARMEFVSKLAKLRTDHMVEYTNQLTGTTATVLFPASDADRKGIALEKILTTPAHIEYKGYSKVETK